LKNRNHLSLKKLSAANKNLSGYSLNRQTPAKLRSKLNVPVWFAGGARALARFNALFAGRIEAA